MNLEPELWFEWNGVRSYQMGVEVLSLPGALSWPLRDDGYPVPGRDGSLHIRDGAREELTAAIGVYLPYEQGGQVAPLKEIKAWLTGEGALRFSDQPGRHFLASIVQEIVWQQWVPGFADIVTSIPMTIRPYARFDDAEPVTVSRSGTIVNNPGTAHSLPKITVEGSGDVAVTINAQLFTLEGLASGAPVTLDTETGECYTANGSANAMISGDIPRLEVGANVVSWVGTVEKIRIDPAWRDV